MTNWGTMKVTLTYKTNVGGAGVKASKRVPDYENTGKFARVSTYGGSLTENIVQAVARDLLADALVRVDAAGYPILGHVHDEIIAQVPCSADAGALSRFEHLMAEAPVWAAGMPIVVDAQRLQRYRE